MGAPPPIGRRGQVLGNPFVLVAGALVIAIAAAIGVAIALGRGGTERVTVVPRETGAAGTATPRPMTTVRGPRARATTTLTVRAGPGTGFISLGVVARGTELEVVAKSDSEQWLEVIYPPRSRLRGWVELEDVEFRGNLAALPLGGAEVFVLPAVPTPLPVEDELEGEATPESLLPDLVPSDAFVAGNFLVVSVTNAGTADLVGEVIDVGVYDASLSHILRATRAGPLYLAPGESVDISTGFRVQDSESRRVVIVVNAGQTTEEGDVSNNSLVFVVTGGGPTATETPRGERPSATATRGPVIPVPSRSPTRTPRVTATATGRETPTPALPIATHTPTPSAAALTPTPPVPAFTATPTLSTS